MWGTQPFLIKNNFSLTKIIAKKLINHNGKMLLAKMFFLFILYQSKFLPLNSDKELFF